MTKYEKYELKSYPRGEAMTSAMNDIMIEEYKKSLRDRDDRIAELRAALEAVEFLPINSYGTDCPCPWCNGLSRKHKPDCQRQIALGLAVKP